MLAAATFTMAPHHAKPSLQSTMPRWAETSATCSGTSFLVFPLTMSSGSCDCILHHKNGDPQQDSNTGSYYLDKVVLAQRGRYMFDTSQCE